MPQETDPEVTFLREENARLRAALEHALVKRGENGRSECRCGGFDAFGLGPSVIHHGEGCPLYPRVFLGDVTRRTTVLVPRNEP